MTDNYDDHQPQSVRVEMPDTTIDRLTIKDLVEAAYLHGLCVENLDTGELEPPRDISDVQWIIDKLEHKIAQEANKARLDELTNLTEHFSTDPQDRFIDQDLYIWIWETRYPQLTAEKGSNNG